MQGLWKKRQETFSPKKLQPGMAVLLRTEPDDAGQWNKVWSLGRVIRVNLPKGTIDVTWLKPERLVSGAGYALCLAFRLFKLAEQLPMARHHPSTLCE